MKKLLYLSLAFVLSLMCLCLFSGCKNKDDNKVDEPDNSVNYEVLYNAVLYDSAVDWIKEDFQTENSIEWKIVDLPGDSGFQAVITVPKSMTFIVDTQEKYDEIFVDNLTELETDFNSSMLIVYSCSSMNVRHNYLIGTELTDDVIKIICCCDVVYVNGFPPLDACQPYQRWFVVSLDKLEINSLEIEFTVNRIDK